MLSKEAQELSTEVKTPVEANFLLKKAVKNRYYIANGEKGAAKIIKQYLAKEANLPKEDYYYYNEEVDEVEKEAEEDKTNEDYYYGEQENGRKTSYI